MRCRRVQMRPIRARLRGALPQRRTGEHQASSTTSTLRSSRTTTCAGRSLSSWATSPLHCIRTQRCKNRLQLQLPTLTTDVSTSASTSHLFRSVSTCKAVCRVSDADSSTASTTSGGCASHGSQSPAGCQHAKKASRSGSSLRLRSMICTVGAGSA